MGLVNGSGPSDTMHRMVTGLFAASGLFWTATYLLIIRIGIRQRTYGMPVAALCANLSWEFIFVFVRPDGLPQLAVNITWLGLDVVVAYTVLRYGPREFPGLPRGVFHGGFAGTLVLAYLGVDLVSRTFDDGGGTYAAFGQNLMMSALFIAMLGARHRLGTRPDGTVDGAVALAGQSPAVAATKLIGTALASTASFLDGKHDHAPMLLYLYGATAVLDVAYLAAVLTIRRRARTPVEPDAVPVG
jgi:hypothetical protein